MALSHPFRIDAAAGVTHESVVLADDLLGNEQGYGAIVRHEEILQRSIAETDDGVAQREPYESTVLGAVEMESDDWLLGCFCL